MTDSVREAVTDSVAYTSVEEAVIVAFGATVLVVADEAELVAAELLLYLW